MTESLREVTPNDARRCGEAVVAIALERLDQLVLVPQEQRMALAFGGLVARGARFVRAAYLLADHDLRPEAAVFVRALTEYAITARWLALDPPKHLTQWAIDDMRSRLLIAEAASRLAGVDVLEPAMRAEYERLRDSLQDEWRQTVGEPVPKRMPSLETRARETGNHELYNFAYRFDSQTAVHPTAFAVDQLLESVDGGVRIRPAPTPGHEYADAYAAGAVAFVDLLEASAIAPEIDVSEAIAPYKAILHGQAEAVGNDG